MKQSRYLIEKRKSRNNGKRLYAPHIRWRKWLYSGSQEDEALPQSGRQAVRKGMTNENLDDVEAEQIGGNETRLSRNPALNQDLERAIGLGTLKSQPQEEPPNPEVLAHALDGSQHNLNPQRFSSSFRGKIADAVEWIQDSEDVSYALKLAAGVFLLSWPAFVPSLNSWYSLQRGGTFTHIFASTLAVTHVSDANTRH